MSTVKLDIQPSDETLSFDLTAILDGASHRMRVYQSRYFQARTLIDFYDSAGNLAVGSAPVTLGCDILFRQKYREIPQGILYVVRTDGGTADPTGDDFARGRAELRYTSADDPLAGDV